MEAVDAALRENFTAFVVFVMADNDEAKCRLICHAKDARIAHGMAATISHAIENNKPPGTN